MTLEMTAANARRGQKPPKRLQIYHHPKVEGSETFANEMARHLQGLGVEVEAVVIIDVTARANLPQHDMIVVIGGDGTMLRGGCMAALHSVPVLGVGE